MVEQFVKYKDELLEQGMEKRTLIKSYYGDKKELESRQMDLQPEMRDILMRNGIQAHIIANGDGYQLAVQGHDSPLLTYNLTETDVGIDRLGTNSANKKAYNVFTSIIGKDFYMPRNLVHAKKCQWKSGYGTAWI